MNDFWTNEALLRNWVCRDTSNLKDEQSVFDGDVYGD